MFSYDRKIWKETFTKHQHQFYQQMFQKLQNDLFHDHIKHIWFVSWDQPEHLDKNWADVRQPIGNSRRLHTFKAVITVTP